MNLRFLLVSILALGLNTACTDSSSGSGLSCTDPGSIPTHSLRSSSVNEMTTLANNQVAVSLGGNYINEITTSVVVCVPGSTTQCRTINNLLVDTGSNGLRIFTSALNGLSTVLPNVTDGSGNYYGTCVVYADTTSQWGPVKYADIKMNGLTASSVPIQVIDSSFGGSTVPESCTNQENSPAAAGYNGIIGVGLLSNDCPTCVSSTTFTQNPEYYSCTTAGVCSRTCQSGNCAYTKGTVIPAAKQVTNPVSLMPTGYNNGIKLTIDSVATCGQGSAAGVLTLGIGSDSTNTPDSTVKAFGADGSLNFRTTYSGNANASSFIDSGSNAYYFYDNTGIGTCSYSGYTFYCPSSSQILTATVQGASGSTSTASQVVSFYVTTASDALSSSNSSMVFPGYSGAAISSGSFDWGLNFFMGNSTYVGITGTSATFSAGSATGPYWAF